MAQVPLQLSDDPLLFPEVLFGGLARHPQGDLLVQGLQQALLFLHLLLDTLGTLRQEAGRSADWWHILLQDNTAKEAAREFKKAVE